MVGTGCDEREETIGKLLMELEDTWFHEAELRRTGLASMIENKQLKKELWKVNKEMLEVKFQSWRELQCATNPQYSLEDEIAFLNEESDEQYLIKEVFEELNGDKDYDTETKTYQE